MTQILLSVTTDIAGHKNSSAAEKNMGIKLDQLALWPWVIQNMPSTQLFP